MSRKATTKDQFGFLPVDCTLHFEGGSIFPLSDLANRIRGLRDSAHPDGYHYPPIQWSARESSPIGRSPAVRVPNSDRPAMLWNLAPSHALTLNGVMTKAELRSGAGALLLHATAYLYGYRLQFEGWSFDGRIPFNWPSHAVVTLGDSPERFLSTALASWSRWQVQEQKRFTNLLYLHARVPTYEWDWERFTHEYMVTDALYKQAEQLWGRKTGGHANRISFMLEEMGLATDEDAVQRIVDLRNGLLHEGLWDRGSPGMSISEEGYELTRQLRSLNQRLIPAMLGHRSNYVTGRWTDWRSPLGFD